MSHRRPVRLFLGVGGFLVPGELLVAEDFFDAGAERGAVAAGTVCFLGVWPALLGGVGCCPLALGALGEGTKNCLPGPFGGWLSELGGRAIALVLLEIWWRGRTPAARVRPVVLFSA